MTTPMVYEWMGGAPALEKLFTRFYACVPDDELLGPVFAGMDPHHAQHVAAFVGEVFGGPALREDMRRRWISLLLDCADEIGVPDDPEFRSAFVAYLEWGTRLLSRRRDGRKQDSASTTRNDKRSVASR